MLEMDVVETDIDFKPKSIENGIVQEGMFKCFECIFTCTTTVELGAHYQIHREREPFKCFTCGYIGEDKEDFLEHSISHIENNYFKCSRCNYKTNTLKAIKAHLFSKHDKPNFDCSLCGRKFTSELKMMQHEKSCTSKDQNSDNEELQQMGYSERKKANPKSHQEIRKYKFFNNNNLLKEEIDTKEDPVRMFTCPSCYFIFPSKEGLSTHDYGTHLKNWKVLNQRELALRHSMPKMAKSCPVNPCVHLEKLLLCSFCHIIFSSECDYYDHDRTHGFATDCHLCGSNFDTNAELREHISEEHPESLSFSCSSCEILLTSEAELRMHARSEHCTKATYSCPLCPRLMKTEQGQKAHIEAHSKVKSLKCSFCNYTAINPSDLKKHLPKHAIPNLACPNRCGSLFKRTESLHRHVNRCSAKKSELEMRNIDDVDEEFSEIEIDVSQKEKFICSECKTSFAEPSQLKEHLLGHFQKSPFRCQKCGLRCASQPSLEKHIQIHCE